MSPQLQRDLLFATRSAISAHNVQPFRFLFQNNQIEIHIERKALLSAADPHEKDLRMSLGALIEAWNIFLSGRNHRLSLAGEVPKQAQPGSAYAVVQLQETPTETDRLLPFLEKRFSYRGGFHTLSVDEVTSTSAELERSGFRVVTDPSDKKLVAELYQHINHASMIKEGYIEELFSWLRFKQSDPRWSKDGLNVESLSLSGLEAFGASLVMEPQVFRFLDRLKLASPMIDETSKITSAPWIAAIVCPEKTSDIEKGRIFLRHWLELTSRDLYGAPLSLLTDSAEIMERLKPVFHLKTEETFVNVIRCGHLPKSFKRPEPARLSVEDLLWKA